MLLITRVSTCGGGARMLLMAKPPPHTVGSAATLHHLAGTGAAFSVRRASAILPGRARLLLPLAGGVGAGSGQPATTSQQQHHLQRVLHTGSALSQQMVNTPYGEVVPSKRAHWNTERILATSLIGIIPLALNFPSFGMDMLLSTTVLLHAHWGMVGVGGDYGQFLPGPLPKAVQPAIYTASALAFACLTYFNYNDVGVASAIRLFWTLG